MNAAEFKAWRQNLNLTQQEVAERVGVSRTTIQNWENNTPIPQTVDISCKVWEHRIKQEDPGIGPLTLIYSDGPMFIDPYGPRRRPAMMQQEPYPTNAAVLARVQQLAGQPNFNNPFVLEADQSSLWNLPELARVISGEDKEAPTLANMLRKTAKIVRDNSANFVRSGAGRPTPAEVAARQEDINAQADLLDKFASGGLQAIVRDQVAIDDVFAKLRALGLRAPDALVSGIAFACSVFDRYPLVEDKDDITEDGNDFILHYKGYEGRFPKIPIFSNKWTINLCSNDRQLFTRLGGRNIPIDGRTREEAIANTKRYVDELG
ncbi:MULTISPECIES: helix-turn-helix transcriptional regulator [unclassified Bradyrhizobium]|uniref:helix-turn-helix transcriptional regulator n=1 Tax=unclassified Bradyrhizobium TaxID=2631580 RepID=UPI002916D5E3|nr:MULTISPECIES: helix-turn-helix transcriptional regulator [unclassified Bradyrhizobium]